MQESSFNLGVRETEGEVWPGGIGYIILPSDVSRDKYVAECFRTKTVSISTEFNGFFNRVPIDLFAFNFINFPLKQAEFGSAISYIIEPVHKTPIIVGIYTKSDEYCDLIEYQFKFRRELNGNFSEIVGSPAGKYLNLNVGADSEGKIELNVTSLDESGKIKMNVDGDFEVTALNSSSIKQYESFGVSTADRNDSTSFSAMQQTPLSHEFWDKEHDINTSSFRINKGKEAFVLGNILKKLFDNFITEVSKCTVTTALGQMPILNAQKVAEFKQHTATILSEVGFIDK